MKKHPEKYIEPVPEVYKKAFARFPETEKRKLIQKQYDYDGLRLLYEEKREKQENARNELIAARRKLIDDKFKDFNF